MSTLGGYQDACGGYHEYTGGVQYTGGVPSVHWGILVRMKKATTKFPGICSRTFCDYAAVYIGLWNIRQLVKISLSGS